jgi:hypothetical protein
MILIPPFKNFNHSDMCYTKQSPPQKSLTASPLNVPDKPKPHYMEKGCFDNGTLFYVYNWSMPGYKLLDYVQSLLRWASPRYGWCRRRLNTKFSREDTQ